ncbi:hypothetical protein GDO81_009452 [Engystomops pustulosus]|uniref:Uncharacterized protein n=1 Tax=Engystomops pustulosus TaxID=76066 RepID=A0AAV7BRP3_ENGPU|nr:hypothetical protein GDO81_009452 [Engystomops pustulosus]
MLLPIGGALINFYGLQRISQSPIVFSTPSDFALRWRSFSLENTSITGCCTCIRLNHILVVMPDLFPVLKHTQSDLILYILTP